MIQVDKTKPDVLRLTEYILNKSKNKEPFSVQSAASSNELNGISRHRIAQLMRDICLDPEDEGSLAKFTTVNNQNWDNNHCMWQLNATAYFSYLSYLSVKEAEKSNRTSTAALVVAIVTLLLTLLSSFL